MTSLPALSASTTPARPLPRAPLSAVARLLWDPYTFMATAPARHGDVFLLDVGVARVAVLSHPDAITHVLRTHAKNYPKEGAMWDGVRTLMGNGLVVSQGPHWQRQRRMMQPHFKRARLAAIVDRMSEAIEGVLDAWDDRTDGPINMNALCPHLTMAVTVRAVFGTGIDTEDVQAVGDALAFALRYLVRGMALSMLPRWLPLPGRRRYAACLRVIDDVVYRMIERCRQEPSGEGLLRLLIDARDQDSDEGMSDQELHDEVLNLFIAGYETTATGMAWALYAIAEQPWIGDRIREEVRAVAGDAPLRAEHLHQLTWTRMVVKEALRRYAPAWQVMRTAVEDDEIGGYTVPAGTQIMLSFCGSHLHPQVWPEPERFDPTRFTPEAEAARPRDAWMPFGTGKRMCIGKELSLMEGSLLLAQILRRHRLSPLPDRSPVPRLSLVTTSRDGIWLQLTPLP
ncbi:MAG: cytochrome P450 [Alphaproteobacteria bacterium]|nr:cytochrome P450 [Alphaproteobacteria bacterium]